MNWREFEIGKWERRKRKEERFKGMSKKRPERPSFRKPFRRSAQPRAVDPEAESRRAMLSLVSSGLEIEKVKSIHQ